VAPESPPFDPKAYGKMSAKEQGDYMASLFVRNLNGNADKKERMP
jgi:hypothetical protein